MYNKMNFSQDVQSIDDLLKEIATLDHYCPINDTLSSVIHRCLNNLEIKESKFNNLAFKKLNSKFPTFPLK